MRGGRRFGVACLVVVALATFFRLYPIGSGLPYSDYVDEGYVLHDAIKVLQERTYDIGDYQYPALPAYLVAGVSVAFSPVYGLVHGHPLEDDFPAPAEFHTPVGDAYDLVSPATLLVLARAVVVALGIGTVALTGVLARAIAGRSEALLAMLLLGVCPASVTRSSIVIVDPIGTFFVVATLCFCVLLSNRSKRSLAELSRPIFAAGCAAALAFVSKYPLGAVFVAVLAAVALLDHSLFTKLRLVLLAAAGFVGTSIVAMPPLFLKPRIVFAAWQHLWRNYELIQSHPGYWGQSISSAELGLPLVAAGLGGVAWMLCLDRRSRAAALCWLAFAAVLLAVLVGASFQPFRNLLSLVPLLCLAAAVFLWQIHRWIVNNQRIPRRLAAAATPLACVLLVASLSTEAWQQIHERATRVDTRVQAIDWLQQHTGAGDRILALRELAILPSEWKRLRATPQVVSWFDAAAMLDRESFDYVVVGEPDLRLAKDAAASLTYRDKWHDLISPLPRAAVFGDFPMFVVPYLWRTYDERIAVLKTRN